MLLGCIVLALPLGVAVGTGVHGRVQAELDAQRAERSSVPATLLADAVGSMRAADGTVGTSAEWRSSAGPRSGRVAAPAGARNGSVVDVWIDRQGQLTSAPLGDADVAVDVVAAVVLSSVSLMTVASLAHLAVVGLLDRTMMRRWTTEWASVEPLWASRFR
jgi:hypothetical protein